ncbi:MAG: tetratricopeptide repeat protein [Vicinamibacterales bacterium]
MAQALSPAPADRYASASAMTGALFPVAAPSSRPRWPFVGAVIVLTAVVAAVVAPFAGRLRLSPVRDVSGGTPPLMLLTHVENRTGEPEMDGVTEVLRSQLAQSPHVEILEPDDIARVLSDMRRAKEPAITPPVLREAALRQGARLVLYPQLSLAGGTYQLDLRLEAVGARPSIVEQEWRRAFKADSRERLMAVLREASNWVRDAVGESPSQRAEQDRPPADITTGSWDALRLFARATESYEQGDLAKAVVLLQEAVRLDPEFVSGYMRLGDALIALRRDREGYAAWARAVELGNTRQLTTREALRLRGQFLEDTGSRAEAEAAFRAYVLHYPADFNANMFLAGALLQSGRTAEALEWLTRARQLRPSSPAGHVHLYTALIELGRLDEAEGIVSALQDAKQTEWATWTGALISFARGHLPAALGQLDSLRQSPDPLWVSRSYTLRASWLSEAGHVSEAEADLRDGIAFDAAKGFRDREALKWIHLAELRANANDPAASAEAATHAIAVSSDLRTLTLAGSRLARLGDIPAAEGALAAIIQQHPDVPRVRVGRQRVAGEIELARRRPAVAIDQLDAAARAARFTEDQTYYARGLVAMRRYEEAEKVLASWVEHPARFYGGPEPGAPGPWTAALAAYSDLLRQSGKAAVADAWQLRLRAMRADDNHR